MPLVLAAAMFAVPALGDDLPDPKVLFDQLNHAALNPSEIYVARNLYLTRDRRCSRYNHGRPGNCTCFPIDGRDLRDVGVTCGYSFPPRS